VSEAREQRLRPPRIGPRRALRRHDDVQGADEVHHALDERGHEALDPFLEEDPGRGAPERVRGQEAAPSPGEQRDGANGDPREAGAAARPCELTRGEILFQHAELLHLRDRVRLPGVTAAGLLQDEHAAILQHPVHLGQDVGPFGNVMERAVAQGGIHARRPEGQGRHVPGAEPAPQHQAASADGEHVFREIERNRPVPEPL
jgi:hypothetical protein